MTVKWNAPAVQNRLKRAARRGLASAILIVEARAIQLILRTAKTGRKYRRRGVVHQASAPGEPFASDTGDTISRRETRVNDLDLNARLTFLGENAPRLEFGTKKMKPRPFARRALSETRQQVQDVIAGEIAAELSR